MESRDYQSLDGILPIAISSEVELVSFKKKLKSFFCGRLSSVFNQDYIRSYELVCSKRRQYCHTLFLLTFFSSEDFLFLLGSREWVSVRGWLGAEFI